MHYSDYIYLKHSKISKNKTNSFLVSLNKEENAPLLHHPLLPQLLSFHPSLPSTASRRRSPVAPRRSPATLAFIALSRYIAMPQFHTFSLVKLLPLISLCKFLLFFFGGFLCIFNFLWHFRFHSAISLAGFGAAAWLYMLICAVLDFFYFSLYFV